MCCVVIHSLPYFLRAQPQNDSTTPPRTLQSRSNKARQMSNTLQATSIA
jgi:hypothetical protein